MYLYLKKLLIFALKEAQMTVLGHFKAAFDIQMVLYQMKNKLEWACFVSCLNGNYSTQTLV